MLPQRAGLPGLNGGGAAAAVPPEKKHTVNVTQDAVTDDRQTDRQTDDRRTQACRISATVYGRLKTKATASVLDRRSNLHLQSTFLRPLVQTRLLYLYYVSSMMELCSF